MPNAIQDAILDLLLLLGCTGGRPPLGHPLRPARPPERRGRGASETRETLKMRASREKARGKVLKACVYTQKTLESLHK
jgi:hypothetical protein